MKVMQEKGLESCARKSEVKEDDTELVTKLGFLWLRNKSLILFQIKTLVTLLFLSQTTLLFLCPHQGSR